MMQGQLKLWGYKRADIMGDFKAHNASGTDLEEVLDGIFLKGATPGQIIGIVIKGKIYHVAYWTYD